MRLPLPAAAVDLVFLGPRAQLHQPLTASGTARHTPETYALAALCSAAACGVWDQRLDYAETAERKSFFSLLQMNGLNKQQWHSRQGQRLAIETVIERTYHRRRWQRRPVGSPRSSSSQPSQTPLTRPEHPRQDESTKPTAVPCSPVRSGEAGLLRRLAT